MNNKPKIKRTDLLGSERIYGMLLILHWLNMTIRQKVKARMKHLLFFNIIRNWRAEGTKACLTGLQIR